jgi:hypothetical protein
VPLECDRQTGLSIALSRVTGHDKEDRPGMWPEAPLGPWGSCALGGINSKWTLVPLRKLRRRNIQ